ncbi:hypothetical protein FB451DRAFT_1207506 [Mycena latifolia]|nr:hypothetical protein FB451DRAFT_1207506 [Mycena latifolia]
MRSGKKMTRGMRAAGAALGSRSRSVQSVTGVCRSRRSPAPRGRDTPSPEEHRGSGHGLPQRPREALPTRYSFVEEYASIFASASIPPPRRPHRSRCTQAHEHPSHRTSVPARSEYGERRRTRGGPLRVIMAWRTERIHAPRRTTDAHIAGQHSTGAACSRSMSRATRDAPLSPRSTSIVPADWYGLCNQGESGGTTWSTSRSKGASAPPPCDGRVSDAS